MLTEVKYTTHEQNADFNRERKYKRAIKKKNTVMELKNSTWVQEQTKSENEISQLRENSGTHPIKGAKRKK